MEPNLTDYGANELVQQEMRTRALLRVYLDALRREGSGLGEDDSTQSTEAIEKAFDN